MASGNRTVSRTRDETMDRLKLAMSGGNFEITGQSDDWLSFRHGTYLTQSATLLPKAGTIRLVERGKVTDVSYEIDVSGLVSCWLTLVAVVFCWAIFPPILAYRALVYHPRRLMEDLLQAL